MKMYRVWRKNMSHKYNGFEEVTANTPQEAIKEVAEFDYQTGDMTTYTYEVDRISDLSGDGGVIERCGEV